MHSSISSLFKGIEKLEDNKCRIYDSKGKVLLEVEGDVRDVLCQLFVAKDRKLYDIIYNNGGKYELQEHSGEIKTE